jgi:hypothetical protein
LKIQIPLNKRVRINMNHFDSEYKGSKHYLEMDIEPWDVIDTWPKDQRIGAYRGELVKYVMRIGHKDTPLSDATKALHLASKLVEVLSND